MKKDSFTKTDLKERGWTDALIRDYLGDPDEEKKHHSYNSYIKLYKIERVEKVESTEEFEEAYEKSLKRRKSAKKAVDTKLKKAKKLLDELNYSIGKKQKKENLIRAALEHYNSRKEDTSYWGDRIHSFKDFNGTEKEYESFLKRICVNYLRHSKSEYDYNHLLIDSELKGKVGVHQIRRLQRNKILELIQEKYPWLADEAEEQKH